MGQREMSGLRPCPNCAKQLADDADVCPKCGAPHLQRKWALQRRLGWRKWASVFVVAIIAAAAAWWMWWPRP
jgi:predicted amidophosphoribosyltransferase